MLKDSFNIHKTTLYYSKSLGVKMKVRSTRNYHNERSHGKNMTLPGVGPWEASNMTLPGVGPWEASNMTLPGVGPW